MLNIQYIHRLIPKLPERYKVVVWDSKYVVKTPFLPFISDKFLFESVIENWHAISSSHLCFLSTEWLQLK